MIQLFSLCFSSCSKWNCRDNAEWCHDQISILHNKKNCPNRENVRLRLHNRFFPQQTKTYLESSLTACKLLSSWSRFATLMKWARISARTFADSGLSTSWTTQKETWLNRRVSATTFGATSNLFFLFHEQLVSSSGPIPLNRAMSSRVNCEANSSGVK